MWIVLSVVKKQGNLTVKNWARGGNKVDEVLI